MLIQFSINNFRTFKDKATLSFVASNYDKDTRERENVLHDTHHNLRLLKSSVIYGANASGKSKLIEALVFMKTFAINSSKNSQKGDKIAVEPFKLNSDSAEEPSEFEVVFTHENILYRYGFEANNEVIISEWLYSKPKTKEIELFYREYQNFEIHKRSFQKGNTLVKEGLVRDNALLLSVAAQFNEKSSVKIIEWFKNINTISGDRENYKRYAINKAKDVNFKNKILELLKAADLGIQDIQVELMNFDRFPKEISKEFKEYLIRKSEEYGTVEILSDILTYHKKYDNNKNPIGKVCFSLNEDESFGTGKFFALTAPVIDALENGQTLMIDELDSKLHPNLVNKIVSLFNSKEKNPKNAQLLFNTHNTNLLSSGLFRRDQIWFTEKNKYGEAKLYSLADFKSDNVRKNDLFEDNYIKGKYGAVPYLVNFDHLIH